MISVLINGTAYTAESHYSIKQQAGAISTSDIDVLVPSTASVPVARSAVQILNDGTPFFYGYITSVETPEFCTGRESQRYRLELTSAESVLKNRLVSEALVNTTTTDIVQTLFDNYISEEGFTLGEISYITRSWDTWNKAYYNLYSALQDLADDCGALFYISPDKKFYFQQKSDLTQIDIPEHVTSLKRTETADGMITQQTIAGATEETDTQTEQFLWSVEPEAYQSSCVLAYPVESITAVYIGESLSTGMSWTQVDFGVKGTDDDDATKTFLYTTGSTTLAVNGKAVTKPSSSVPYVKVVYVGTYDIIVTDTNNTLQSEIAKLNGTSGKIEAYTSDSTIETFQDADTTATNLLDKNNERSEEISAKCHGIDDTGLYMVWNIQNTDARIAGVYVIVERTIEDFGPDAFFITVKLKNRNLYSRYGTVLKSDDKTKKSDTLVYKTAIYTETLTAVENWTVTKDVIGFLHFPASSGIAEPSLMDGLSATAYSGFTTPNTEWAQTEVTVLRKNMASVTSFVTLFNQSILILTANPTFIKFSQRRIQFSCNVEANKNIAKIKALNVSSSYSEVNTNEYSYVHPSTKQRVFINAEICTDCPYDDFPSIYLVINAKIYDESGNEFTNDDYAKLKCSNFGIYEIDDIYTDFAPIPYYPYGAKVGQKVKYVTSAEAKLE